MFGVASMGIALTIGRSAARKNSVAVAPHYQDDFDNVPGRDQRFATFLWSLCLGPWAFDHCFVPFCTK
jgi:hypothetical protein